MFRFIIGGAPKLKKLHLVQRNKDLGHEFFNLEAMFPVDVAFPHFPSLTYLRMRGFNLESSTNTLLGRIDVSKLKHLELTNCSNVASVIDGLSAPLSGNTTNLMALVLTLEETNEPDVLVAVLEKLFKTSSGLCQITVDVDDTVMLDTKCFFSHSETLRSLILGTRLGPESRVYSAKDMGEHLAKCLKLEELAINLPQQFLGHVSDLGENFRLRSHLSKLPDIATELERMLVSQDRHRFTR
jgi:hypothetical protein